MSTVLIVQSDTQLIDIWRVALESSGHVVVAEETVSRGISQMRSGGIDVVVMDDGDGGSRLTVLVDELDRLPDAPPVVLVAGSPESPGFSARMGAAAFLTKPCSPGELDAVVSRVTGCAPRNEMTDEPTKPRMIIS